MAASMPGLVACVFCMGHLGIVLAAAAGFEGKAQHVDELHAKEGLALILMSNRPLRSAHAYRNDAQIDRGRADVIRMHGGTIPEETLQSEEGRESQESEIAETDFTDEESQYAASVPSPRMSSTEAEIPAREILRDLGFSASEIERRSSLHNLGYSASEIEKLNRRCAETIVAHGIHRPSAGVPKTWNRGPRVQRILRAAITPALSLSNIGTLLAMRAKLKKEEARNVALVAEVAEANKKADLRDKLSRGMTRGGRVGRGTGMGHMPGTSMLAPFQPLIFIFLFSKLASGKGLGGMQATLMNFLRRFGFRR